MALRKESPADMNSREIREMRTNSTAWTGTLSSQISMIFGASRMMGRAKK